MFRFYKLFPTFLVILLFGGLFHAQEIPALTADDPPFAPLISFVQETETTVTVSGEAGAVFPAAQVAVRNVYTGETVYASAAANGSFQATLNGTDAMPYQVNSARAYPLAERENYDTIPGAGVIVYPDMLAEDHFSIGGEVSYGASYWLADGEINALNFDPGDDFSLTLDVRLFAPDSDPSLEYTFWGSLSLLPLFDAQGHLLGSGENWSAQLVAGLPILGVSVADIPLMQAEPVQVQAAFPTEEDNSDETIIPGEIAFTLDFSGALPDNVVPGGYVLVFTGSAAVGDSQPFDWYANRIFGADFPESAGDSATVLPMLLQVGEVESPRMLWGVLDTTAAEDVSIAGTVDLIQHTPEIPVFNAGVYELVPRLYGASLLPLNGGDIRLSSENASASVPAYPALRDGVPYLETYDERFTQEFLASADPAEIEVSGTVEDAFGRSYTGGGIYSVQFAEPLTLHPPVLAGTPFVVGQSFPADFAISPTIPGAEKSVTLRFMTLDGTITEQELTEDFAFTEPGVYVVDYHTQAEADETIWAVSRRVAGVVTQPGGTGYGVRGLANYDRSSQVWFDTAVYPMDAPPTMPILNFPHFPGDVVYLPDGNEAALKPILSTGDIQLMSVVHPGFSVRQFGQHWQPDIASWFTADDLPGGQIGAGSEGLRPGDVLYLFGNGYDYSTIAYAAVAVITDRDSARVAPPFNQPLLQDRGEDVWLFVQPTGIRPGDVVQAGESIVNRGIVAPTLPASVQTSIIQPDGETLQQEISASTYGYYQGDAVNFAEAGVYQLRTEASFSGETSAGTVERPVTGGLLGVDDGYFVFAVPGNSPALETTLDAVTPVQQPFSIPLRVPEGWTDVTWYSVVRTPQWVLDQNTEPLAGTQASYYFDAGLVARTFSFLENQASADSDRDEITFTFAMTGTDSAGEQQIRARVFTLRGTTLYTFED